MDLQSVKEGARLSVHVAGRIDTKTAPELEAALGDLAGVGELALDFTEVPYVSSAGLRVLLALQKTMNKQGSMSISHVCEDVMDVFDMTGFSDVLTIVP